jgi:hypothetical protein
MTEESKRPILVYMRGVLPSLTPTERLIAEYILKDPERILSSSIAELRDGTGSSVQLRPNAQDTLEQMSRLDGSH